MISISCSLNLESFASLPCPPEHLLSLDYLHKLVLTYFFILSIPMFTHESIDEERNATGEQPAHGLVLA